mgnify:CR=1 FL=1
MEEMGEAVLLIRVVGALPGAPQRIVLSSICAQYSLLMPSRPTARAPEAISGVVLATPLVPQCTAPLLRTRQKLP